MKRPLPARSFRLILAASLLAFLVPTFCLAPLLSPPASQTLAAKTADLKDRLEKGLKARRPEEFKFIDRVVALVEKDKLPLSMVDGTFHWARRKAKHRFQYFEAGLRKQAKKIGVKI